MNRSSLVAADLRRLTLSQRVRRKKDQSLVTRLRPAGFGGQASAARLDWWVHSPNARIPPVGQRKVGQRRNAVGARAQSAFTLVELLVVIAIIALLAGLIVGLTGIAGVGKVRSRLSVERDQIVGAIESYHKHYGFYPQDNPDPKKSALSPLYYELTGTTNVAAAQLTVLGVAGIANVDGKNFFPNLKPSGFGPDRLNQNVLMLVVPYGPPPGGINTWRYRSSKPEHNTESYDLWAEAMVSGKMQIIGNWRD